MHPARNRLQSAAYTLGTGKSAIPGDANIWRGKRPPDCSPPASFHSGIMFSCADDVLANALVFGHHFDEIQPDCSGDKFRRVILPAASAATGHQAIERTGAGTGSADSPRRTSPETPSAGCHQATPGIR